MATDSFFTQGSKHKICQDYAIHGPDFVIISDGCSSAPDSDFGARILARAAVQVMQQFPEQFGTNRFYTWVLALAQSHCQAMNLPLDCLYATLIIARKLENQIHVTVKGDGLLAVKRCDGKIYTCAWEFPFSAPFFLRYHLTENLLADYMNKVGGNYMRRESILSPDGHSTFWEASLQADNATIGLEYHKFDLENIESVAIMSDGVASFVKLESTDTQKQVIRIETFPVVRELLSFKNYVGEFVQRRCKAAFKRFDEEGWKVTDDFSIGVIGDL